MSSLKNISKGIVGYGTSYVYHYEQNKVAQNILKVVELQKGKLNSNVKKICKEYALDTFGDKKYAPWLYTYSAFAKEFKEGWIPDNFYGEVVVPQLNGDYGKLGDRNAVINKIIEESDSLDICYYVNKLFLNPEYIVLNEDKLRSILFSKYERVVFKIENSIQGKGIYFFDKNSFDITTIKKLGNGVFQKFIEQHSFFSEFNKSSVSTIRITSSSNDNGDIDVRAGFLKFGRKSDTHVKTASAIKIPINIKNGKLMEDAYLPNWSTTKQLPDNNISFAGKSIPLFDDCLAEIKKMHRRIPFVRCVGWDVIVDKNDKIKLIELNGGHNGIKFHEMVYGPCFKDLNWENLKK
ncbi:sugar-transfer associated ATP-grasp domain-containing protein [Winogradskyella sp. SM1960]|uniref:sugar-transfer associated ATP-grasp domain-containing protein n=1 Tax=Winogradskyella sp. SM1960 TaxID=2865955 RepID=UPI001CD225E3|nr:sugar-transfer associated ATP-grasp domain-containing protein [Winogradskyella sp. SM1960]